MSKFIFLLLISSFLLTSCVGGGAKVNTNSSQPAIEQKQGDTTKTGTLSQSGSRFFLQVSGGVPEEIESYKIDLSQYVGQTVTVTGQYSGDTLFVGSIE